MALSIPGRPKTFSEQVFYSWRSCLYFPSHEMVPLLYGDFIAINGPSCANRSDVSCWNRRIFRVNSMSFHGFLYDSMPTPFVGSRTFLLYDHEGLFLSCFQKILCFYHVYNEPESPVIRELTHFHRLHQHKLFSVIYIQGN